MSQKFLCHSNYCRYYLFLLLLINSYYYISPIVIFLVTSYFKINIIILTNRTTVQEPKLTKAVSTFVSYRKVNKGDSYKDQLDTETGEG